MTRTLSEETLRRLDQALTQIQKRIGQLSYSHKPIEPAFAVQVADTLRQIQRELLSLPVSDPKSQMNAVTPAGKL